MKRVRRWVGLAGLVTGAVLAVPGVASATVAATWADAAPVTFAEGVQNSYPFDEVTAVSCASAGNCTAAGFFLDTSGYTQAFTQTSTDGVWALAVPAEFGTGVQSAFPNAKFVSVSCASAGNCTAAGYFKNANGGTEAFTQTSTSGTWAPAVPASFGAGVQNDPPSARFLSVSCASAGNCTAAGYFLNADYDTEAFTQTSSSGVWAQPVPASFGAGVQNASEQARFTSVSCASAGNCTAAGYFRNASSAIGNTEAFTQTSSSGVWAEGVPAAFGVGVQSTAPNDRFLSVSCVSAGNCTAGGYFIDPNGNAEAFTQTSTAGTWAQAVPASFGAGVQMTDPYSGFSQFFSVSCSSAGNCAAVGSFTNANGLNEAFAQISTSGVWAEADPAVFPEGVQRAVPDAGLKSVSCASDGNCTAVGSFADPNYSQQAFSQTLTNGVWDSAVPAKFADGVQSDSPFASLSAVSCTSADTCTAGGTFKNTNYGYPAFTQTLTAEAPVAPSISSVSPTIVPVAGGSLMTIAGSDFDTGGVTVTIGASSCVVTNVTATAVTCRLPSLASGLQDVTVTNTGSTLSNTLSNGVRYVDSSGWISAKFPPPSADGTKLSNDLQKILDSRGNCNRDIDKLFKDLYTLVKQSKLTLTEANQAGAFFLGLCTQQTNSPAPVAPIHLVGAPVGTNPPAPTCSAAMNPSTFTLDFSSADSPVAQFSFERSGFDTAGFWVRVDSGDWTPAVGLVPPNGSGSGIGWSSEFVQSLLRFGGVETLSAVNTYTLDVAFGTAGALDAYDAANAACQMTLSVYVATLPETGGNTTVPLELAILFTLAGTAFIGLGRRRRTA